MAKAKSVTQSVTIHNKISYNYKTLHVDGAFGGFSPRGLISLSFFSERFPIPRSSEFAVKNGKIGEPISDSPDSKVGILREYEAGIIMDINVAKDIVNLLKAKILELELIAKEK